jgi:hypothetical protein
MGRIINSSKFYIPVGKEFRGGDIFLFKKWNHPCEKEKQQDGFWIILSHNCDILHKEQFLIAKIMPMASLTAEEKKQGKDGMVRNYRTNALFYLPGYQEKFGESFVHYGFAIAILKSYFEEKLKACRIENIVSLTDNAKRLMLYHFSEHITRDVTGPIFKDDMDGYLDLLSKE